MKHLFNTVVIFGGIGILLVSCQPKSVINESYLREKKEQEKKALTAWNESYVNVAISIDLIPYLNRLNEAVPVEFHQANWSCEGVSFDLNAERKPLNYQGKNQEVTFSTLVDYDLKINYCPKCTYLIDEKGTCITPRIKGSCGIDETKRKAEIGFTSKISLLPNYRFSSKTKLTKLTLIDPCQITLASIDITDRLKKELATQLALVGDEIDKKIGETNLENEANETWNLLTRPISIQPYGQLYLNPYRLAVGLHSFDKNKLNFPIEMQVKPLFSTLTTATKKTDLPELSSITGRKGVDLTLQLDFGYDSISAFLSKAFYKKKFSIKNKTVHIDSIRTLPTVNAQMSIDAYFSGDMKGQLKFVGTPCLNETTQQLIFPDFVHQLKFSNGLYTFIAELYRKKIAKELTAALDIPLDPLLSDLKKEIENAINSELSNDIKLTGAVHSVQLQYIEAKELFLKAFLRIDGEMKLSH